MVNTINIELAVEGMRKAGCIKEWIQRKVIREIKLEKHLENVGRGHWRIRETGMTRRLMGT